MAKKPFTWSYSALTNFENCPHQYASVKVHKRFADKQTEAIKWGNEVHKALELRVKNGTPLPEGMTQWESIAMRMNHPNGITMCEQKMALTREFQPTEFFAEDVWFRGVIDVAVMRLEKAVFFDYKTGKRKPDSDQLELFAASAFHHYPSLNQVATGFIWLKEQPGKQIDQATYTRDQLPSIWNNFLPRVKRMELAYDKDEWQKKPSGLCGQWCSVTDCEFNGRRGG